MSPYNKERQKLYYLTEHGKEQNKLNGRNYRKRIKERIFDKLGRECSNPECPIPKEKMNICALQIDHKKDNGAKERKKFGRNTPAYYRQILEHIEEYQTLCAYCNWVKRYGGI